MDWRVIHTNKLSIIKATLPFSTWIIQAGVTQRTYSPKGYPCNPLKEAIFKLNKQTDVKEIGEVTKATDTPPRQNTPTMADR